MMPSSRARVASVRSTAAAGFKVREWWLVRGAVTATQAAQATAIGTTAVNNHRQDPVVRSAPPPMLPTAPPMPDIAAQMAMACERLAGGVA
jgi:hypothetical protein